ncbi:hypothetical protein THAOC_23859, partial [Thalassiosira oceanica]
MLETGGWVGEWVLTPPLPAVFARHRSQAKAKGRRRARCVAHPPRRARGPSVFDATTEETIPPLSRSRRRDVNAAVVAAARLAAAMASRAASRSAVANRGHGVSGGSGGGGVSERRGRLAAAAPVANRNGWVPPFSGPWGPSPAGG